MPARRALGAALVAAALLLGARCGPDLRPPATFLWASGFDSPVYVTAPAGDARLFVLEQGGRVRIVDAAGNVNPADFLDIQDRVSTGFEGGLLGLAFPPDFVTFGQFYVYYTALDGSSVLSRFQLSADPEQADAAFEKVLLQIPQPDTNHNGGTIAFSPVDGMLYWGLGDGGGANDTFGQTQNPSSLLGKMLRLDVGADPVLGMDPTRDARIPADNPFVGVAGFRPEIWALGLRNPYRFGFDRLSGELWIADVGQGQREELNREPAGSGGRNYGWPTHEGSRCHLPTAGLPCEDPAAPATLTFPFFEYEHSVGCSITGGAVNLAPPSVFFSLVVVGDFCSGRIFTVQPANGDVTDQTAYVGALPQLSSVSEGGLGRIWLTTLSGEVRLMAGAQDRDGDGFLDADDVCPDVRDPDQLDGDGDGTGDACTT